MVCILDNLRVENLETNIHNFSSCLARRYEKFCQFLFLLGIEKGKEIGIRGFIDVHLTEYSNVGVVPIELN